MSKLSDSRIQCPFFIREDKYNIVCEGHIKNTVCPALKRSEGQGRKYKGNTPNLPQTKLCRGTGQRMSNLSENMQRECGEMTCKDDCLHHPVCRLPFNTSETQVEFAQVCHHFKNKADFVEVKHGEWIAVPSSDMSTGKAYKCSNCEKMRYGVRLPPYCQECGAKMDEERKVENG